MQKAMTERFEFFWKSQSPFSNWHPAAFEVDGITFNCTEQYMMYKKALLFEDLKTAQEILDTSKPGKQKALGRKVSPFDPEVWNKHCKQIVKEGCLAKFTQNQTLKERLLATGSKTLVEASPIDAIWGIGLAKEDPRALSRHTWRGKNWLGEVLTEVKQQIREENL